MLADYTQQLQQIDRERKEIGDNTEVYTTAQRERLEHLHQEVGRVMQEMTERPVTERDLAITYQRIALSQLDSSDEDSRAIIGVLTRVLEYLLTLPASRAKPWASLVAALALHVVTMRCLCCHAHWIAC